MTNFKPDNNFTFIKTKKVLEPHVLRQTEGTTPTQV